MRLWSISPEYLDTKGLLGLWREALLARKVIEGKTIGYKNHPQLVRFRNYSKPLNAINSFLYYVFLEGKIRGYNFDKSKIKCKDPLERVIPVSRGQVEYEFNLLLEKLKLRDMKRYSELFKQRKNIEIKINSVFFIIDGGIELWEKIK